jgi:hypothetical protein
MTAILPRGELSPGARVAIRRYSTLAGCMDRRDIEQEAALATVEARSRWRQDGGASAGTWEARCVAIALARLVGESRAPVSLPKHKGESWHQAAAAVAVPLCLPGTDGGGDEIEHPALASAAVARYEPVDLDRIRAQAAVLGRLAAIAEHERDCLVERATAAAREARAAVRDRVRERRRYDARIGLGRRCEVDGDEQTRAALAAALGALAIPQ